MSLLLRGRCVTARGGDLQCLWPLVSPIHPPPCSSSDRLTHLRRPEKRDREHFIPSGVCCHFTLALLLLPLSVICPSACAEMGRWSVCQKIKVTSLHSSSSSSSPLQLQFLFFPTTKRCFRLPPSCRGPEPRTFGAAFPRLARACCEIRAAVGLHFVEPCACTFQRQTAERSENALRGKCTTAVPSRAEAWPVHPPAVT